MYLSKLCIQPQNPLFLSYWTFLNIAIIHINRFNSNKTIKLCARKRSVMPSHQILPSNSIAAFVEKLKQKSDCFSPGLMQLVRCSHMTSFSTRLKLMSSVTHIVSLINMKPFKVLNTGDCSETSMRMIKVISIYLSTYLSSYLF